ncbi:MAG: 1-hydroxycarotenoid 3,4-desaturase CrtD [Pseudomonadota bacterium]
MAQIGVIGAGVGGLSAVMRLAHKGHAVDVFEAAQTIGGKMRTLPSAAGPVDAGPTVLTMKHVFEAAFRAAGESLHDHVTLHQAPILARHFWQDAPVLDFFPSVEATSDAVGVWGGADARADFLAFHEDATRLFDAFDDAMMYSEVPSFADVTRITLSDAKLFKLLARGDSMESYLTRRFREPRLAQLFGRYATYVGGSPGGVPMVLSLIAKSEANGVWAVEGGMHTLAQAMADVAEAKGAVFHLATPIDQIDQDLTLRTQSGRAVQNQAVLFNGDPAALRKGLLGSAAKRAVSQAATAPRSLSANVWAFSAAPAGPELAHHNVFFAETPNSEFAAIGKRDIPEDPTLYICAQDRGAGTPAGPERFEIIMNAAATDRKTPSEEEARQCAQICFQRLKHFGLTFTPEPTENSQTGPVEFARLFPGSDGSLYGRSPSGMMASFQRPTVRSRMKGLYLCGGGVHPGAGVPMASLSGQHAAAAILSDLTSTSKSHQTVTHGGMSTA